LLRGDSSEVNVELMAQLTERLSHAGVEILEVRLSHLAYAPEIAGVMLRRQQAEAIIDARQRIVEGAVGMVKMALDNLHEQKVVDLDEASKAKLASNLLVVLCSDSDAQPVVSTGA
jgi:regulator of protease activity HflC (stomatin/prohibitin superfamily)